MPVTTEAASLSPWQQPTKQAMLAKSSFSIHAVTLPTATRSRPQRAYKYVCPNYIYNTNKQKNSAAHKHCHCMNDKRTTLQC